MNGNHNREIGVDRRQTAFTVMMEQKAPWGSVTTANLPLGTSTADSLGG